MAENETEKAADKRSDAHRPHLLPVASRAWIDRRS